MDTLRYPDEACPENSHNLQTLINDGTWGDAVVKSDKLLPTAKFAALLIERAASHYGPSVRTSITRFAREMGVAYYTGKICLEQLEHVGFIKLERSYGGCVIRPAMPNEEGRK